MSKYEKVVADGSIPAVQAAAKFALEVQDAVNLYAITNAFLGHIKAMRDAGLIGGDLINNHPVTLAFVSKLESLCRTGLTRELDAFDACHLLAEGKQAEYEVIPL